jgi:predicted AAA+ superfamily ATPase
MFDGASIPRPFWLGRLEAAWSKAPIAWLSGVRRSGKSWLAAQLPGSTILNCDLPSVQRLAEDPESLYGSVSTRVLVLDEVHRLADPSMVLKIGADTRTGLRILATGSSTLAALRTFRDSLTGRKRDVALQPVLFGELPAFGGASIERRLLHGGLPQMLLADRPDPGFYSEWLDSYYARDVAELFRVERRREFLLLARTLIRQSGGMATVTSLAKECGVSRPTVTAWMESMRVTHLIHEITPFHGNARRELLKQPKVYAFDTGFVAHENGWDTLRPDECGRLWENVVLEHLLSRGLPRPVRFWRKDRHEVDFILPGTRGAADALECKWSPDRFDPEGIRAFRALHPVGRNYLVCPRVTQPHVRRFGDLEVHVVEPTGIALEAPYHPEP